MHLTEVFGICTCRRQRLSLEWGRGEFTTIYLSCSKVSSSLFIYNQQAAEWKNWFQCRRCMYCKSYLSICRMQYLATFNFAPSELPTLKIPTTPARSALCNAIWNLPSLWDVLIPHLLRCFVSAFFLTFGTMHVPAFPLDTHPTWPYLLTSCLPFMPFIFRRTAPHDASLDHVSTLCFTHT